MVSLYITVLWQKKTNGIDFFFNKHLAEFQYLYIASWVKAIKLVEQLQHGSLNFTLSSTVWLIPA